MSNSAPPPVRRKLYQVMIRTDDGHAFANVIRAVDDVDALDQLHACHRVWRKSLPWVKSLTLSTYVPGVFDPKSCVWTSAAPRTLVRIHMHESDSTNLDRNSSDVRSHRP